MNPSLVWTRISPALSWPRLARLGDLTHVESLALRGAIALVGIHRQRGGAKRQHQRQQTRENSSHFRVSFHCISGTSSQSVIRALPIPSFLILIKCTITNYCEDSICNDTHLIIHQNSGFARGKTIILRQNFTSFRSLQRYTFPNSQCFGRF